MLRKFIIFLLVIGLMLVANVLTASAGNGCGEQVFRGSTLEVTTDYGASYQPVIGQTYTYLLSLYVCPITSPVTLGAYQALGFRADQLAMTVYISPDNQTYYLHREWKVFAFTAKQWSAIAGAVGLKARK